MIVMSLGVCEIYVCHIICVRSGRHCRILKGVEPAINLISLYYWINGETLIIAYSALSCDRQGYIASPKIDICWCFDDYLGSCCGWGCVNCPGNVTTGIVIMKIALQLPISMQRDMILNVDLYPRPGLLCIICLWQIIGQHQKELERPSITCA